METSKPIIYFVEKGLYKARLNHLTALAEKSNFLKVNKNYSNQVTHVLAQDCTKLQVLQFLKKVKKLKPDELSWENQKFVNISWFTSCMKEKELVPVLETHLLKDEDENIGVPSKKLKLEEKIPMYACQRSSPLNHKNKIFTDALEVLEEHALYRGDQNADARSLAFRRGSSTLKSLKHKISHINDLKNLPHIDIGGSSKPGHCKRVIIDILANGHSTEVEEVTSNEFYQTMKLFCGIFGVGPQTARKWFYDLKLRTLDDVKNCSSISLNRDQSYGLEYYEDLNSPLPLLDAKRIENHIREVATSIQEGIEVILVGGFRRGKQVGHDIDLLITHPEDGKEKILHKILDKLKDEFVYTDKKAGTTENPYHAAKVTATSQSTTDHFEKCYGIFKVDKTDKAAGENHKRTWTARRVDLIVVPYSQFPFAVLGWTGSKHFEREIRRYSKSEKQIVLTSHGMYTLEGKQNIPASSEKEIFELLGLEYQDPEDRNC
ncbi:DNA-directed DNA/RNA polymerase mu-like [Styela clava]